MSPSRRPASSRLIAHRCSRSRRRSQKSGCAIAGKQRSSDGSFPGTGLSLLAALLMIRVPETVGASWSLESLPPLAREWAKVHPQYNTYKDSSCQGGETVATFVGVETPDECQVSCDGNSLCKAYSYSFSSGVCSLRDGCPHLLHASSGDDSDGGFIGVNKFHGAGRSFSVLPDFIEASLI